jgi:hypothetical protein
LPVFRPEERITRRVGSRTPQLEAGQQVRLRRHVEWRPRVEAIWNLEHADAERRGQQRRQGHQKSEEEALP